MVRAVGFSEGRRGGVSSPSQPQPGGGIYTPARKGGYILALRTGSFREIGYDFAERRIELSQVPRNSVGRMKFDESCRPPLPDRLRGRLGERVPELRGNGPKRAIPAQ